MYRQRYAYELKQRNNQKMALNMINRVVASGVCIPKQRRCIYFSTLALWRFFIFAPPQVYVMFIVLKYKTDSIHKC